MPAANTINTNSSVERFGDRLSGRPSRSLSAYPSSRQGTGGARCRLGHHGRARRAASDPTGRAANTNCTSKPVDLRGVRCCGRSTMSLGRPSSRQGPDGARCRHGHHGHASRAEDARRRAPPTQIARARPSTRVGPNVAGDHRRRQRARRAARCALPTRSSRTRTSCRKRLDGARGRHRVLGRASRLSRGPLVRTTIFVISVPVEPPGARRCALSAWSSRAHPSSRNRPDGARHQHPLHGCARTPGRGPTARTTVDGVANSPVEPYGARRCGQRASSSRAPPSSRKQPDGARRRHELHGRALRLSGGPIVRTTIAVMSVPVEPPGARRCALPTRSSRARLSSRERPDGARRRHQPHGHARRLSGGPMVRTSMYVISAPVEPPDARRCALPTRSSRARPSSRERPDGAGRRHQSHGQARRLSGGPMLRTTIFVISVPVEPPGARRCALPTRSSRARPSSRNRPDGARH